MFFPKAWLLAGLLPSLVSADTSASLDIWNIDFSCTNYPLGDYSGTDYQSYLIKGLDDALLAFTAARDSLTFVLKERPDKAKDKDGYIKWIRIADSVAVTLGFKPDANKEESATDQWWSEAFDVLNKAIKALPGPENDPPKGYNPVLHTLDKPNPMLICGEKTWQWLKRTDKILGTTMRLMDNEEWKDELDLATSGAWYLQDRYLLSFRKTESPEICTGTVLGETNLKENLITICPRFFEKNMVNMYTMKQFKEKKKIKADRRVTYYAENLGGLLIHELLHFYGGVDPSQPASEYRPKIIDQPAVNPDGDIIYWDYKNKKHVFKSAPLSQDDAFDEGLIVIRTYGVSLVWNLAKPGPNSGPQKALKSAESLGIFCYMMFYDDWDWAENGVSRVPGQLYDAEAAQASKRDLELDENVDWRRATRSCTGGNQVR